MEIKGYTLANDEKVRRAIEGNPTAEGTPSGGVGADDEAAILARYDQLGGLILNADGRKIKNGCFVDLKTGKPIAKPKVFILVRVNGTEVEVPEGEPLPLEAQAEEILEQSKAEKAAKKTATVRGGKGKAVKIPKGASEE